MITFDASCPQGFVPVSSNDLNTVLSSSGRAAFMLHVGDRIEFSDSIFQRQREVKLADGQTATRAIAYIGVLCNGKQRFMPFSMLRDIPHFDSDDAREAFYENAPFLRELHGCLDDAERFAMVKDLVLTVTETRLGKARDWKKSPNGTPTESVQYRERPFPILAKAE